MYQSEALLIYIRNSKGLKLKSILRISQMLENAPGNRNGHGMLRFIFLGSRNFMFILTKNAINQLFHPLVIWNK